MLAPSALRFCNSELVSAYARLPKIIGAKTIAPNYEAKIWNHGAIMATRIFTLN